MQERKTVALLLLDSFTFHRQLVYDKKIYFGFIQILLSQHITAKQYYMNVKATSLRFTDVHLMFFFNILCLLGSLGLFLFFIIRAWRKNHFFFKLYLMCDRDIVVLELHF